MVTATTWLRFDRAIRPFHDQPPSNCSRIAVETYSRFVVVTAVEATAIVQLTSVTFRFYGRTVCMKLLVFAHSHSATMTCRHTHMRHRGELQRQRGWANGPLICCMNRCKTVCVSLSRCTQRPLTNDAFLHPSFRTFRQLPSVVEETTQSRGKGNN